MRPAASSAATTSRRRRRTTASIATATPESTRHAARLASRRTWMSASGAVEQEAEQRQRQPDRHEPASEHPRTRRGSSALEQVDVLQIHRLLVAEDREDDGEPDRGFGRGDRHHEEHEDLAARRRRRWAKATNVRFTALSISSTHMKITIALRRISTPTTPIANSTAETASDGPSEHHSFRFASTTAPTIAASSSRLVISNGSEVVVEQRRGDRAHDALLPLQRFDGARRQLDHVRRRRARAARSSCDQQPQPRAPRRRSAPMSPRRSVGPGGARGSAA